LRHSVDDMEDCTTIIRIVPAFAIGMVIGKGGRTIDQVGKENACKVEFLRCDALENGDTPVRIRSLNNRESDALAASRYIGRIVSIWKNKCF
jgi:predicted PilT family ATPase